MYRVHSGITRYEKNDYYSVAQIVTVRHTSDCYVEYSSYAGITRIRFKGPEATLRLCISAGLVSSAPVILLHYGLSIYTIFCGNMQAVSYGCAKSTVHFPPSCHVIASGLRLYSVTAYPSAVSDTVNSAIPPFTQDCSGWALI